MGLYRVLMDVAENIVQVILICFFRMVRKRLIIQESCMGSLPENGARAATTFVYNKGIGAEQRFEAERNLIYLDFA